MLKPKLYQAATTDSGVSTLFTHEANTARLLMATAADDAVLDAQIAAGALTFVEPCDYFGLDPMYQRVHSGDAALLMALLRRCEIEQIGGEVVVPFSCRNYGYYEQLLQRGYGPKPDLVGDLIAQGAAACAADAESRYNTVRLMHLGRAVTRELLAG